MAQVKRTMSRIDPKTAMMAAAVGLGLALWLKHEPEGMDLGDGKKPPTEEDISAAHHWAMGEICKSRNFSYNGENMCEHNKASCEAGPGKSNAPDIYGEWHDGRCINADLNFKHWCEEQGLSASPNASGVWTCKTNPGYCKKKVVDWTNGDCNLPCGQWVAEQIFGTTVTRGARWLGEKSADLAVEGGKLVVEGVEYIFQSGEWKEFEGATEKFFEEDVPTFFEKDVVNFFEKDVADGFKDAGDWIVDDVGGAFEDLGTGFVGLFS